MRRYLLALIWLGAWSCTTSREVAGPHGEGHVIRCNSGMEACLTKASELCDGKYEIEALRRPEMLVTCRSQLAPSPSVAAPESQQVSGRELLKSEPPVGAAGVTFGTPIGDAKAKCEESGHRWKGKGDLGVCSGLIEDVGYPGRLRVQQCEGNVCEVRLILKLADPGDSDSLLAEYGKLVQRLKRNYGSATTMRVSVNGLCREELKRCLGDGSAELWSTWQWGNGARLQLEMVERDGGVVTYVDYIAQGRREASGL